MDDVIDLLRRQSFRDMNTGVRLSLEPGSIFKPSSDQIKAGGNYNKGNVQFLFRVLNLGKNKTDATEFRAHIQTLHSVSKGL